MIFTVEVIYEGPSRIVVTSSEDSLDNPEDLFMDAESSIREPRDPLDARTCYLATGRS